MQFSFLSMLAISTALCSQVFAESYPTTWLLDNELIISQGDDVEIYAVPELSELDLGHIDWQSGTLRLTGCILDSNFGDSRFSQLPLVVQGGQILFLNDVVIQDAEIALHILDGQANLENVTLATSLKGVFVSDPVAIVNMIDVRVTIAEIGLDLQSASQVSIDSCLFLSNELGINQACPTALSISNTLFQANEQGLFVHDAAQMPVFGSSVDFVDTREFLISNQSTDPIDLDGVYLSDQVAIDGTWIGNPAPDPYAPLFSEAPPVIIGAEVVGDDVPLECIPAGHTPDGIPCKTFLFELLYSTTPYGDFEVLGRYPVGEQVLIPREADSVGFYRARTCLGEWLD